MSNAAVSGSLNRVFSIDDMRERARRRLPASSSTISTAAPTTNTRAAQNAKSFAALSLIQRVLVDVAQVDTGTTLLGMPTSAPFILSSTGASRFYHSEGELAAARAAAQAGVIYGTTSSAMFSLEEVAGVGEGPRFFQVYVFKDRAITGEYVQRCREAGYGAMFLTVDCATAGNRERDLRNRLSIPPKATPGIIWQLLKRPAWTLDYLTSRGWRFPQRRRLCG